MSINCNNCKFSHLMKCEKEGENFGKSTLLISAFGNIDECYEQRVFEKKIERNEYYKDLCETRGETRQWYDMTGNGDRVYRIGYWKENGNKFRY